MSQVQVLRCSRLRNIRGWGAGNTFRQVQVLSRVGQELDDMLTGSARCRCSGAQG